jgi:hypothetical protein
MKRESSVGCVQAVQVRLGEAERAASSMASRLRDLLLGACVLCRRSARRTVRAHRPAVHPRLSQQCHSYGVRVSAAVSDHLFRAYTFLIL